MCEKHSGARLQTKLVRGVSHSRSGLAMKRKGERTEKGSLATTGPLGASLCQEETKKQARETKHPNFRMHINARTHPRKHINIQMHICTHTSTSTHTHTHHTKHTKNTRTNTRVHNYTIHTHTQSIRCMKTPTSFVLMATRRALVTSRIGASLLSIFLVVSMPVFKASAQDCGLVLGSP